MKMGIGGRLGQGYGRAKDVGGSIVGGAQRGYGGAKKVYGVTKTVVSKPVDLMTGIAAGGIGAAKKVGGANIFVILAALLFLFDTVVEYKGFYITNVDPLGLLQAIGSFGYLVGFWALFLWLMSKDKSPKVIASYAIIVIALMISIGLAFRFNPIAMVHVIYILILWFFFVRGQEDAFQSNKILLAFLFVDLYLFSILAVFSPWLADQAVGFPFLFLATMFYVREKTGNTLALVFIFLAFGWYFLMGGPALATNLGLAGFEGIVPDLPSWGEFWKIGREKWIEDPIDKIGTAVGAWVSGQIQYAISGKVEENEYEPLGVYLENVQSADQKYYEDEDVIVWGTVKARTLDDPINIQVGCYTETGKVRKDKEKIYASINPSDKFSVFTLEENDFVCTFDKGVLKEGSSTVKTFADFNFETLAYLKAYFINRDRQRAMIREGQDIFEVFDIKDKNPVAVYTNGPATIEMGTTTPLIGVSETYIVHPALDIGIKNKVDWEGKINQLKELVLFFPKGVELESLDTSCNHKFLDYKLKTEGDEVDICNPGCVDDDCDNPTCTTCYGSCNRFVYDECMEVKDNTIPLCEDNKVKCQKVCDSLFREGDQEYNGYTLDLNDVRLKDEEDFEKFKVFRCRFTPVPSEVLGTSPITTKYFRVKARYNYTVEKSVSVVIKKVPDPLGIEEIGGRDIEVTSSFTKKVYDNAENIGVDPALALALVAKESSFTHCCKESGGACEKSEDESCDFDRLVTSGSSYGIMQLNSEHCAFFYPDIVCDEYARPSDFSGLGCSDGYNFNDKGERSNDWAEDCRIYGTARCEKSKDATDVDCNIKLGLTYLKTFYNNNRNKVKVWTYNSYAVTAYNTWDLALRLYNGWNREYNGWSEGSLDLDYVKDINEMRQDIRDHEALPDLEKAPPTPPNSQQTPLGDKIVAPPTNLEFEKTGNGLTLKWDLSIDDGKGQNDVIAYVVYRIVGSKTPVHSPDFLESGEGEFVDKDVDVNQIDDNGYLVDDDGNRIKHRVVVQDKNSNIASIEGFYKYEEEEGST